MKKVIVLIIIVLLPQFLFAQGLVTKIRSLNEVLNVLYDDMMPLCSRLIGVGRGIAGFAATWYIAARVWGHIARAEAIDFYPLFRPFVLGFCILIFPSVVQLINQIMKPTVTGTAQMVKDSDLAVERLLKAKEDAIKTTTPWKMYVGESGSGDRALWYKYNFGDKREGWLKAIGHDIRFAFAKLGYNLRNAIREWIAQVLKVLFEAAALCINTIRTFYLIVLAILGPLVFGIAVFDGFQHTLTVWIARYLNIFLWLPVANIFGGIMGKIQENMLKEDLHQIATHGDTFFSTTDSAYLIFMVIGIVGYFTVPSVANYIIHAGGNNALLQKVTNLTSMSVRNTASGSMSMGRDALGGAYNKMSNSMADSKASDGYFKDKISGKKDV